MQQTRKLYITNISRDVGKLELTNAVQTVCATAKTRLYKKGDISMGCGDATFQTIEECHDFLQQQKVKPLIILGQQLHFQPFRDNNVQESQYPKEEIKKNYKLIGFLPLQQQLTQEQEILKQLQKYSKHISGIAKRQIIFNGESLKCYTIIASFTQCSDTPEQMIIKLSEFGIFRYEHFISVKDEQQLQRVRILVRNLPNCSDEDLTLKLIELFQKPFKHVKRVKNYCFVTLYSKEDTVSIVKQAQFKFSANRTLICDFTSDQMRDEYKFQEQQGANNGNQQDQLLERQFEEIQQKLNISSSSESSSSNDSSNANQLQIEEYDKKKGVQEYINQQKEEEKPASKEESSNSDSLNELADFVKHDEIDKYNNPDDLEKEEDKKIEKTNDEFTLFITNLPPQLPLDILQKEEAKLQKKNIFVKSGGNLVQMTLRQRLFDLFKNFGKLQNVVIPLNASGRVRGIAFVKFFDNEGFQKSLQYLQLLKKFKQFDNVVKKSDEPEKEKFQPSLQQTQLKDDFLFQQTAAERELNGFKKLESSAKTEEHEQLDKICVVQRSFLNILQGAFQLYDQNLICMEFMQKKQLARKQAEFSHKNSYELLKYGLLVPTSVPNYDALKISPHDQAQRAKLHTRRAKLTKDPNYEVNNLRIELRNFDRAVTSESLLVLQIYVHLVKLQEKHNQCIFTQQQINKYLRNNASTKWQNLMDYNCCKRQNGIQMQQLELLADALKIQAIRIPRSEGKCFEMIRNFNNVVKQQQSGALVGVAFFDLVSEDAAKRLIDILNNADLFYNQEKKAIVSFCLENKSKLQQKIDKRDKIKELQQISQQEQKELTEKQKEKKEKRWNQYQDKLQKKREKQGKQKDKLQE